MEGQLEILNAEDHGDVRMLAAPPEFPICVQVVMSEFSRAAATCPLFFLKDPETGRFNVVALFGLVAGEILVDGAIEGTATFIPMDIVRQGFYASDKNISIDLSNPRFVAQGPVRLFEEDGLPTSEMKTIQKVIGQLIAERPLTDDFAMEMARLRLIEPIDIRLRFDDGETKSLEGLYTVSLDSMGKLNDADVLRLFRNGYLLAAACIQRSVHQVGVLARRRNERLGELVNI